jgi:hypothetical protein
MLVPWGNCSFCQRDEGNEEMDANRFGTLSEALEALKKKGYDESFLIDDHGMRGMENHDPIRPEDVTIVEYHRFEGTSNPDDMSVVFVIETTDGRRGTLVDAYGTYASPQVDTFVKQAKLKEGLR